MPRVCFTYPNGRTTYGFFRDDGKDPYFEFMNLRYEIKDIIATGAIATANNPDLLKRFNEIGMPCRPTPKQHQLSVSVHEDTEVRMKAAAKAMKRTVSGIIEEIALKWLEENGM